MYSKFHINLVPDLKEDQFLFAVLIVSCEPTTHYGDSLLQI